MFDKKGQSALEYLMTYGWALVVIIIVIAALFALGILSPATYQGDSCRGFGKIAYQDHVAQSDKFSIVLSNGIGKHLAEGDYNGLLDCDNDGTYDLLYASTTAGDGTWLGSRDATLVFDTNSDCVYTLETNYQSTVKVIYSSRKNFIKEETAICTGVVAP